MKFGGYKFIKYAMRSYIKMVCFTPKPNPHTDGVPRASRVHTGNQACKSLTPFAYLATQFHP